MFFNSDRVARLRRRKAVFPFRTAFQAPKRSDYSDHLFPNLQETRGSCDESARNMVRCGRLGHFSSKHCTLYMTTMVWVDERRNLWLQEPEEPQKHRVRPSVEALDSFLEAFGSRNHFVVLCW